MMGVLGPGRTRANNARLYDGFVRADSADIGRAVTGQLWTKGGGGSSIATNNWIPTAAAVSCGIKAHDGLLNKRVIASLLTGSAGSQSWGAVLRYQDIDNMLYIDISTGGDVIRLQKKDAGVLTTVAETATGIGVDAGYVITAEMRGDDIKGKLGGAWLVESSSAFLSGLMESGAVAYVSDLTGAPKLYEITVEAL